VTAVEAALRPLDIARRRFLVVAARTPWSKAVLSRTEPRVLALASASIVVAFALTSWVPGVLFVLGPAILGVPHLASDMRYLVVRQGHPRSWLFIVAFGSVALIGLRLFELARARSAPFAPVEVALGGSWILAGALMGAWRARDAGRWWRGALAAVVIGAATSWAVLHAPLARGLLAFGHNLVAVAIWVVLFRRRKIEAIVPILLLSVGLGWLVASAARGSGAPAGPWLARLLEETRVAAPGLGERATVGLALGYVFLQAVHYSVWLTWIPQQAVGRNATLTFAMSARSLERDFGRAGIVAIIAMSVAVVACSLVSVHRTRGVYLSLAAFHADLELACLAFLALRGNSERAP
jgi:hypothetical protein